MLHDQQDNRATEQYNCIHPLNFQMQPICNLLKGGVHQEVELIAIRGSRSLVAARR